MTEIRDEIFGKDFPASAALTVTGFAKPEILIEIQGIAVVPLPTDYTVTDAQWNDRWRADPAVWVFNLVPRLSSMAELGAALDEYLAIAVYRLRGWL